MRKAIVIINEQHTIMDEQKNILNEKYEQWEYLKVPASGWTLEEQEAKARELCRYVDCYDPDFDRNANVVFCSPIPFLLKILTTYNAYDGVNSGFSVKSCYKGDNLNIPFNRVKIFHNDKREKKELPGGKIINVVSKTGWVLV